MKSAAACILLLGFAVSSARADTDTTYVQVATVEHGSFYWYGHELPAPYDVEVGFSVAGAETTVYGVFVNRFPLVRPIKQPVGIPNSENPEVQLTESIFRGVSQRLGSSVTGRPYLEACAREFRKAGTLVDSVTVPSDRTIVVYWSRNHEPNEMTIGSPDFKRAPLVFPSLERARGLAGFLQRDWIVLIGERGFASYVPPEQAEGVRSSIQRVRLGLSATGRGLNPLIQPYFEHPVSIPTLLKGEGR